MKFTQGCAVNTIYRSPVDKLRIEFLESLRDDMELLGHSLEIELTETHLNANFTHNDLGEISERDQAEVMPYYTAIRNRNLQSEAKFITKMERDGILELFPDGKDLNIDAIQPSIHICETQQDKNIFKYGRLIQSVPTSSRLWRNLQILVYDEGQSERQLMGVIGLSAPAYSLKSRDDYLQWTDIDRKSEAKTVKDIGLKRLAQMSVCMAIGPYNYICAGRLMAALAFTNPIQAEFQARYDAQEPLLGIVTTVITGQHGPIFDRIHPNRISRYSGYRNLLYDRIGETSDRSTVMLSESTIDLAHELVGSANTPRGRGASSTAVQKAIRLCGVNQDIFITNRKGVWFGCLSTRNEEILQKGLNSTDATLEFDVGEVVAYWKEQLLCDKPDRIQLVRSFRRVDNALSNLLETSENSG